MNKINLKNSNVSKMIEKMYVDCILMKQKQSSSKVNNLHVSSIFTTITQLITVNKTNNNIHI